MLIICSINDVLLNVAFWKLFEALFCKDLAREYSRKRPLVRVEFCKPAIPIFTKTFAALQAAPNFDDAPICEIKKSLDLISQRSEVVGRTSSKSMEEFIASIIGPVASHLYSEALFTALIWIEQQGNTRKTYEDMGATLLRILPAIPDVELQAKLLKSAIFCKDIVKEIFEELKSAPGKHLNELEGLTFLKSVLLGCFATTCSEFLGQSDARLAIVLLFKRFVSKEDCPNICLELIDALSRTSIQSSQGDQAWKLCRQVLDDLLSHQEFLTPEILQKVLLVDVGILAPVKLPILFSLYQNTTEWNDMMLYLAQRMVEARQYDSLVASSLSVAARDYSSLITHLEEASSLLNSQQVEHILKEFLLVPQERDAVRKIVFQWLIAFTRTHFPTITKLFGFIKPLLARHLDEAVKYMELFVERCDDETVLLSIVDLITREEKKDLIKPVKLILALKGFGTLPASAEDITFDLTLRLLPALLKKNCSVSLTSLPTWVLDSVVFWESIGHDQAQLERLFTDNALDVTSLLAIVIRKPAQLMLSSSCVMTCIKAVLDDPREGEPIARSVEILLRSCAVTASVELTRSWVEKLVALDDPALLLQLYEAKMIDRDRVFSIYTSFGKPPSKYLELVQATFDALSPSQRQHLKEAAVSCDPQGTSPRYIAFLMEKFTDDVHFRERLVDRLDESWQWSVAVALHDRGCSNLSSVRLETAIGRFLSGDETVNVRDIGRFIRGDSDLEAVRQAIDLIAAHGDRGLNLLDVLLLQRLEIQLMACPVFDRLLLNESVQGFSSISSLLTWERLLQHRLACGGSNIGALQSDAMFDAVLALVVRLAVSETPVISRLQIISIVASLLQYHWIPLMRRRPLLVGLLVRLIHTVKGGEVVRLARLLSDLASHRQSGQQYHVPPLILAYAQLKEGKIRRTLRPAMCMLLRSVDQARSRQQENTREKYFELDPFERLMRLVESDDAKIILKELFTLYSKEFKYTGKA